MDDCYAGRILVSDVGAISRMLEVNTFCVIGNVCVYVYKCRYVRCLSVRIVYYLWVGNS